MRTISYLPLAIALASAGAFAGPQTVRSEPAMTEIQVRGVAPAYKPRPEQVQEIKGVYVFDNGATLKVSNERRRLFAQLGGRAPTEMVPVAENLFTSPDQRMTMEFQPNAFGDLMVLTYPADLNVAGSAMVTVRMAMR